MSFDGMNKREVSLNCLLKISLFGYLFDLCPFTKQPPPSDKQTLIELMLPSSPQLVHGSKHTKAPTGVFDVIELFAEIFLSDHYKFAGNMSRNHMEEISELRYVLCCHFFVCVFGFSVDLVIAKQLIAYA